MSASDQYISFLTANNLTVGNFGKAFVSTDYGTRGVSAAEMVGLMDRVNNTSQLVDSLYFAGLNDSNDEIYARPANGNNWEFFDPNAPLTTADIT